MSWRPRATPRDASPGWPTPPPPRLSAASRPRSRPMADTAALDRSARVARYKAYLRHCIDRRPSGLRQRLATALGKHKSFVSQISNPAYSVPIPAGDLATILEV